jgi:predicted restriction endonuclease
VSIRKKIVRETFRETVFERDNHACKCCGDTDDLAAHHITDRTLMPNGGYHMTNGITLCPSCHNDAEMFHVSDGEEWMADMHPNDLYKLIDSDYETAYLSCRRYLSGPTNIKDSMCP